MSRRTSASQAPAQACALTREEDEEPSVTLAGTHRRAHTRATNSWPRDTAKKPFLGTDPVRLTQTLIWLMRDRGMVSPDDLRGRTHAELMYAAMGMKAKRTSYATFGEALADAMTVGWIESYESEGELFYLPNYRHGAKPIDN